jgi:hypothetical protein
MGRETLFFHALVVEKSVLFNAKVDVSSLFAQGVFVDKMPSGDIAPLCVDVASKASQHAGSVVNMTVPCVIRAEKPLLDIVRAAVGDRALELSWATFAFQQMQSFDVQVIPPRVLCPRMVNEYDTTGTLLRSAVTTSSSKEDWVLRKNLDERTYASGGEVVTGTSKDKSSAMLGLSVAINIVLSAVCSMLFLSRRSVMDAPPRTPTPIVVTNTVEKMLEKSVPTQLPDSQRAEIEDVAIKRFRSELKAKFPSGGKEAFLDFNKKAADLFSKYYGTNYNNEESQENKENFKREHEFLSELEIGINFVNENLLKGKTP